jgi:FdhD protein
VTVPRAVSAVLAIKVRPDRHAEFPEHLVTEEPMEIRVAGPGQEAAPVAVTMRTPGHDFELAAGFLLTEGLAGPDDITAIGYCDALTADEGRYNTVTVGLSRAWSPTGPARHFAASASCGICGKASIDQVEVACPVVVGAAPVPASLIPQLPDRLRESQQVFERTGGLHAAGLFDPSGHPACVREDVGRHNAVDKVVGHTVVGHTVVGHTVVGHTAVGARVLRSADGRPDRHGLPPLAGWVLMVSGRVSFEIVQKAAMGGIGIIAAVSAPSSLAVQAADRLGVAVAGFVRNGSFNVYSHPERLDFDR